MIASARETLTSLPEQQRSKMEFYAGDCSKPITAAGGPFDLVLAVWFLNYASCYDEMLQMWRNIYANLRPGGRLVALTSNGFCGLELPFDDRYGLSATSLGKTEDGGWKCRVTALTQPEEVSFENFHYPHEVYERAAAQAGMEDLRWRSHVVPVDDGRPEGFWDVYNLRPHFSLVTATRP
ncbi:hypothetical protein LTR85_005076 [Meristemomyces frigidus]|nr:hypothetical protein LTR85_005076 [Meristemomyces frigidus]